MRMDRVARPLAVLGALVMAGSAYAQQSTTVESEAKSATQAQVAPRFTITEEQRAKISSLRDQFKLDTAQKKATLEVQQHKLVEMLRQPTVDKPAVLALNAKINALRTELSDARLNLMLAINDQFTPEQKEQMKRFRKGSFFKRHGRGGCGDCGGGRFGHRGPIGQDVKSSTVQKG
ncbi:MAG TPA: periplasmic heavy metal sensor [Candidatus Obscuribacterales bacterium]